ncbi:MAG TPA: DNA-3-methyladenine glycosylase 2 family protein [Candidatus Dormibacteraeota bacterium]|nr:DNA-3-methyladenine glycosylase 2 family protein [Candidatus Dormibacteraeota bacterium]
MTADAETFAAAADELARRDPALARVIAAVGPPQLRPPLESSFASLVRSITFQQLAGRAAAAIHGRFVAALPDGMTPGGVLALPETAFRAAGMSGAKTASIRDLAAKMVDGTVPLDEIEALSDDEIVERLSRVRGIGRWTAEMFLIFHLRRPDVWPVDDLGVRKGYALAHGLAEAPKPRELLALGEPYRPYRTTAAWYCWRAAETVVPS